MLDLVSIVGFRSLSQDATHAPPKASVTPSFKAFQAVLTAFETSDIYFLDCREKSPGTVGRGIETVDRGRSLIGREVRPGGRCSLGRIL
nr:hypothetical protein SHINE37_42665 [Rhizobiaceae bacterium]